MKRFILLVFAAAMFFLMFCCESPALAVEQGDWVLLIEAE